MKSYKIIFLALLLLSQKTSSMKLDDMPRELINEICSFFSRLYHYERLGKLSKKMYLAITPIIKQKISDVPRNPKDGLCFPTLLLLHKEPSHKLFYDLINLFDEPGKRCLIRILKYAKENKLSKRAIKIIRELIEQKKSRHKKLLTGPPEESDVEYFNYKGRNKNSPRRKEREKKRSIRRSPVSCAT